MRRYKALLVLLSLIFLVGQSCSSLGGFGGKNDAPLEDDFKGTEGLIMKFIEGLPPKNVWKEMEFGVWIEAQNKGRRHGQDGSRSWDYGKKDYGIFPNSA